jgi:hypothetical protein
LDVEAKEVDGVADIVLVLVKLLGGSRDEIWRMALVVVK